MLLSALRLLHSAAVQNRTALHSNKGEAMHATATSLALVLAVASTSSQAHHSTAIFDVKTDIELKGRIIKYEWANPHVYLWVESISDSGERITWEVEGGPPPILRRAGITADMLAVGDEITIKGKPGRVVEKHQVLMESLTKVDAYSINFGQSKAIASIIGTQEVVPQPAKTLEGTWGTLLDMTAVGAVVNPADTLLSDKGKQARAAVLQGKIPDNPACTPIAVPLNMMAPDIKHIELRKDEVRISGEWDGIARVVDMKAASHDDAPLALRGHSIGHWEGDTLVVDTARFTANPRGNGYTLPSSEQKHVIERFRLASDGTHLLYSVVLEDAEYMASPLVSAEFKWTYRPDLQYQPLPCDLENALRHTR
jgi:hypothetical protein